MRLPKLRKKKVKGHLYWFTAAAGGKYFGKVGEVSHKKAQRHFAEHLRKGQDTVSAEAITVSKLFHHFLEWVSKNRCLTNYKRRRAECNSFARLVYGDRRLADIPALEVTSDMLDKWRECLQSTPIENSPSENDRERQGLQKQSLVHSETSIRAAFNWGCKHGPDSFSAATFLPVTFRPFSGLEKTRSPKKPLRESDLLTIHEVDTLLEAAAFDVDQFRRWGIEKHIEKHGRKGMRRCKDSFGDILCVYHATGARTSELAKATVGDFSFRNHQITLGEHKTEETTETIRSITLGTEAFEIVNKLCKARDPTEYIFLTAWGKRFTVKTLNTRLHSVRRIAIALGAKVRKDVTVYDFRHLWISDQLLAGTELMTVARMAGTSVAMIEKVYGHFRKDHLLDAQKRLEEARRQQREKARQLNQGQGVAN